MCACLCYSKEQRTISGVALCLSPNLMQCFLLDITVARLANLPISKDSPLYSSHTVVEALRFQTHDDTMYDM